MKTRYLAVAALLTAGAGFAATEDCTELDTRIDSTPDEGATVFVCPCFAPGEVAIRGADL